MISLTQLQVRVYETTKFLGYKVNKELTIKKLKQEIKELKKSKVQRNRNAPLVAANIKDNEKFVKFFDLYLKGTIHDEAPDIILVILSFYQQQGFDSETDLMNKYRYNLYRKKKTKN
ncbi:MAG: hypothetical protein WBA74_10265 [Cyclobacteriaceae bacterium]